MKPCKGHLGACFSELARELRHLTQNLLNSRHVLVLDQDGLAMLLHELFHVQLPFPRNGHDGLKVSTKRRPPTQQIAPSHCCRWDRYFRSKFASYCSFSFDGTCSCKIFMSASTFIRICSSVAADTLSASSWSFLKFTRVPVFDLAGHSPPEPVI